MARATYATPQDDDEDKNISRVGSRHGLEQLSPSSANMSTSSDSSQSFISTTTASPALSLDARMRAEAPHSEWPRASVDTGVPGESGENCFLYDSPGTLERGPQRNFHSRSILAPADTLLYWPPGTLKEIDVPDVWNATCFTKGG
jgi:hypothetical protein